MRKTASTAILTLAILTTLPSFAEKLKGDSTLKDNQPFGTTDKEHKHQAHDLSFDAKGKNYTCRTDSKKSMDATEFVVGGKINYEINNNKATIKTPENKKVDCKIVRVELIPTTP